MELVGIRGIIALMLVAALIPAAAAEFTVQPQLYFTGTSTAPGTLYQDAIGSNADVGIELCGQGPGRYVGAFYAVNINGAWNAELISYRTSSEALAEANTNLGGGCYATVPGFLTVSPSSLSTPNPDVQKAAFPGRLFVGHAASMNPGAVSEYEFGGAAMQLLGDYTIQRSFDQSTRRISAQTPTVLFTASSGSFSKSATDPTFGVASDRPLALAVCSDTDGQTCSDGGIITSNIFPYAMNTGLLASQVNDQTTHTRYVVANGLGKSVCIGANLIASVVNITPDPVYYSQTLQINFTTTNYRDIPFELMGGNVDVTTPFTIRVQIHNASDPGDIVYSNTQVITNTIPPGGTIQLTFNWPAVAHSGTYTVRVDTDLNNDIAECDEGDNSATENFELKAITLPDIFIDGVPTTQFPYPNAPYNLSFSMRNSDNITLRNATIRMVETNGLTIMAPTQIYNRTAAPGVPVPDGIRTNTTALFTTDTNGEVSIYFMPTYNKLYLPQYNYTDLNTYIGDYRLVMTGSEFDGTPFTFVLSGDLTNDYPFSIANVAYDGPYPTKEISRTLIISQVLDFAYQTYTAFLETVLRS